MYGKPKIRYVDMCIYIDTYAYTDEIDEEKMFEYLYHITNMLAHKLRFFQKNHYYEQFALFNATEMFMRYKNPKQWQIRADGTPRLEKIKSVLNYIKKTIYARKVDFEQENYCQYSELPVDELEQSNMDFNINTHIDDMNRTELSLYLNDVDKTIRMFLEKLPYKKDTITWKNIYISCMLSFLNSVTFSEEMEEYLMAFDNLLVKHPDILDRIYRKQEEKCVVLYHLDDMFYNYVAILVKQIKHLLSNEVSAVLHTYVPSDANAKNIMMKRDSVNENK